MSMGLACRWTCLLPVQKQPLASCHHTAACILLSTRQPPSSVPGRDQQGAEGMQCAPMQHGVPAGRLGWCRCRSSRWRAGGARAPAPPRPRASCSGCPARARPGCARPAPPPTAPPPRSPARGTLHWFSLLHMKYRKSYAALSTRVRPCICSARAWRGCARPVPPPTAPAQHCPAHCSDRFEHPPFSAVPCLSCNRALVQHAPFRVHNLDLLGQQVTTESASALLCYWEKYATHILVVWCNRPSCSPHASPPDAGLPKLMQSPCLWCNRTACAAQASPASARARGVGLTTLKASALNNSTAELLIFSRSKILIWVKGKDVGRLRCEYLRPSSGTMAQAENIEGQKWTCCKCSPECSCCAMQDLQRTPMP